MFKFGGWELYSTGDSEAPCAIIMNGKKTYLVDEVGLIVKRPNQEKSKNNLWTLLPL